MKKLLLFTGVFLLSAVAFAQQRPTVKSTPAQRIKINSPSANRPQRLIAKKSGGQDEALSADQLSALRSVARPQIKPVHRNGMASPAWFPPLISDTIIGTTTYDLPTNGTLSNRVVNVNGKISATWTMSLTGNTANQWPDRGTGYNYSGDDGDTWGPQPTVRVETIRTGYQNVACVGFNEVILAHTGTAGNPGEILSSRSTQGSGAWTQSSIPNTTASVDWWPKFTAGGANGHSFHAIWQGTGVNSGPLYYSRSTDDGVTWSPKAELPGYIWGTDVFAVSADCYSIDARGDVIAIVAGDFGSDLVLFKSTDNGTTWTKRIIDEFPIPLYDGSTMNTDTNADGIADTLWTTASDETVLIDNNNKVHVFYGRTRAIEAPGATGLSYFQTQDIAYWNEDHPDRSFAFLAGVPDVDGDGVITTPMGCGGDTLENAVGYYSTGLVAFISSPKASVDANNVIYLSYMAADETSDTAIYHQMFMHPYLIKSADGGVNWTNPTDSAYDVLNASQPSFAASYDGAFPNIARNADGFVHMVYQRDFAPGTTLSGTGFPCELANNNEASNEIVYAGIPVSDIPTGTFQPTWNVVSGISTISNSTFSISTNYPNPFRGKTSVDLNLNMAADVTVEVSDLLGRVLSFQKYNNYGAGTHKLTIDATTFASGIYTYKVKAGNDAVTKKMVVQ
jgi:hypothetical protein